MTSPVTPVAVLRCHHHTLCPCLVVHYNELLIVPPILELAALLTPGCVAPVAN